MSKKLNVPSNADETTTDAPAPPSELELTPRELAIAEDRDPDVVVESSDEAPEGEELEQPAGEVADVDVSDPPAATPAGPWYSSYDRQYAEQHGLSEWHLQQFESRDEFRKAAALLDATAARRQPTSQPEKKAPVEAAPAEYVDKAVVNGKVNVEWYKRHDYDEGTIDAMQSQRDWQDRVEKYFADQEQNAEQQRQSAEEAETQRQINAFHEAADQARPDFYGRTVDEYGNQVELTAEQYKRREVLFDEIYWLSQRIAYEQQQKTGRVAMPSWSALIKQAEVRAFGEELNRKTREQQVADAKAQARTIRPAAGSVGAGTARRNPSPPSDDPKSLAQDPDIIAAWAKAEAR